MVGLQCVSTRYRATATRIHRRPGPPVPFPSFFKGYGGARAPHTLAFDPTVVCAVWPGAACGCGELSVWWAHEIVAEPHTTAFDFGSTAVFSRVRGNGRGTFYEPSSSSSSSPHRQRRARFRDCVSSVPTSRVHKGHRSGRSMRAPSSMMTMMMLRGQQADD